MNTFILSQAINIIILGFRNREHVIAASPTGHARAQASCLFTVIIYKAALNKHMNDIHTCIHVYVFARLMLFRNFIWLDLHHVKMSAFVVVSCPVCCCLSIALRCQTSRGEDNYGTSGRISVLSLYNRLVYMYLNLYIYIHTYATLLKNCVFTRHVELA